MTFDELETAVGQYLEGMGDTPIAWPNADFTPDGIYIEFRHAPNDRITDTGDSTEPFQFGLFLMTVVAPAGGFSTAANALSQQIANRFPKALRLQAGDGNVVINAAPAPGSPFQDGAYWRQPMRVSYITE